VRLGGEVHHGVGIVLGEDAADELAVGDVAVEEAVALGEALVEAGEVLEVARVGQLVEVQDETVLPGRLQQEADEVRADEPGSTGNEQLSQDRLPAGAAVAGRRRQRP